MNTEVDRSELDELTRRIIGCAYTAGNTLGCGFLEKVYENALSIELCRGGTEVKQQFSVNVYYDDAVVGVYTADLIVGD